MSKEFKMGFIEEVEPLKLTTIPKKYQKLIEATENRWFNKMQKLAKMCQKRIDELEHRLSKCIELPVKIGDSVYKICPKCNDNHNGSCKNCAWCGCFSGNCVVGVSVWSDGSYTEKPLQIVEKRITDNNISNVYDWWNIMFFDNEIKAKQAMEEYDQIRIIEDKSERVERFRDWYNSRKIKNPLKLEEVKNG